MSNPFDKDETDKAMIEEIRPAYENMRVRALEKAKNSTDNTRITETDHVRVGGRKMTLILYIITLLDGKREEQFEYYDYRYFHRKPISLEEVAQSTNGNFPAPSTRTSDT